MLIGGKDRFHRSFPPINIEILELTSELPDLGVAKAG